MSSYLCKDGGIGHIRVYPLSNEHGVADLPEDIGVFSTCSGQVVDIRRVPTGPASCSDLGDAEHFQQQIRDIVENSFVATANPTLNVDQPLVLADGTIYTANRVNAVLRVKLKSLAEFPDFKAHMSILNALYQFLGVQSDVATLCNVASAMAIEKGMCLPVTDELGNTSVMKVLSRGEEPECYNVSFYSPSECTEPLHPEQPISRVATWKERGSDELHSVESVIGEIV